MVTVSELAYSDDATQTIRKSRPSRRVMAEWKNYLRSFRRDLDSWAVWEPGSPVELFDFGVLEEGRWFKRGSLWDVTPKTADDTYEESEPADWSFGSASASGIDVGADAGTAVGRVRICFGSRHSLYARGWKSTYLQVKHLHQLTDRILSLKEEWPRDRYIVTGLRTAKKFTVLAASEPHSEITVTGCVPDLQSFMTGNLTANATVNVTGKVAYSFIGKVGPIHIDLVRLRFPWRGKGALRRMGQDEQTPNLIFDPIKPSDIKWDDDCV